MAEQTPSLWSYGSPEAYRIAQQAALQKAASDYAQKTQQQRTDEAGYMAGASLRGGLNSLFGVEDQGLQQVKQFQEIMRDVDRQNPESIFAAAKKLQDINHPAFDSVVAAGEKAVELKKKQADTAKAQLSLAQEQKLRDELAALGPDATEEEYLKVVRKYGKPDEVMKSIEARIAKQAALEEKKRAAEEALAARLEIAKAQNASREELARIMMEGRREIAAMMAQTRLEVAGMKKAGETEKPLTPAQKLKLDKDTAKSNATLRSLDNSLQSTVDLADEISNHPGFKTATGAWTYLPTMRGSKTFDAETLMEEFKDSVKKAGLDLVREGGSIGAMTEKEWPIVEGMVAKLDPRANNFKDQMQKVIAKIEAIRANAYAAHNETFTDVKEPSAVLPKRIKPEDRAAIEWARKNPNDPRSTEILKKNGL